MAKILHFLNGLNYGGAERFLLNLLQNIDKDKYQFDILVRSEQNPMEEEFLQLGANIIKAPSFPIEYKKHNSFLKNFIKKHGGEYHSIHVHANSLIYTLPLLYFKKEHPNVQTILHSHSSNSTNKYVSTVHALNKKLFMKYIDTRIACSQEAGKWMFGKNSFEVIYNGIDIEKFYYNPDSRIRIRKEFNINDTDILLGSVGRLVEVKNFQFLIHLLNALKKSESNYNYKLMIVGTGKLEGQLKKISEKLNLNKDVIFTGQRNDVFNVLSAMDIYLQPSFFEGLPFSVIESQISNLPTLVSKNISKEVSFSDNIHFESTDSYNSWIEFIMSYAEFDRNKYQIIKEQEDKVNIKKIAQRFEKIYS